MFIRALQVSFNFFISMTSIRTVAEAFKKAKKPFSPTFLRFLKYGFTCRFPGFLLCPKIGSQNETTEMVPVNKSRVVLAEPSTATNVQIKQFISEQV